MEITTRFPLDSRASPIWKPIGSGDEKLLWSKSYMMPSRSKCIVSVWTKMNAGIISIRPGSNWTSGNLKKSIHWTNKNKYKFNL